VRAGETYLLPAGTLHSLGPGLLLYEVQQASDTTYRVYDWDRPARAGRELHIEESIAVTDPRRTAVLTPPQTLEATSFTRAVSCPYFELDVLRVADSPLKADTAGKTFHVLTVSTGAAEVSCGGETVRLGRHETALVAGHAGAYEISSGGGTAEVLRAAVPC
jgi:mannose-6-phosphate isomerase